MYTLLVNLRLSTKYGDWRIKVAGICKLTVILFNDILTMIFIDKLKEFDEKLGTEFDRLINLVQKKQPHFGDLLLIYMNGFYNETILQFNQRSEKKYNPHMIGPGNMGHSEIAHYSFIHKYITTHISNVTYPDYLKLHQWTPEKREEIEKLLDIEETSIQLEMLIYLKFWEADLVIKKLYQFVRLLNGESYDWYFKVQESSRDKDCTGSRQDIVRLKIRDRLKAISPILYGLINSTYKTQIRNSIAHSNYSFQGRQINLNNKIKNDPAAQLHRVTFDEWVDIFHGTIALHNQYVKMNNMINDIYTKRVKNGENKVEVMITEKDNNKYPLYVEYIEELKDWKYRPNQ